MKFNRYKGLRPPRDDLKVAVNASIVLERTLLIKGRARHRQGPCWRRSGEGDRRPASGPGNQVDTKAQQGSTNMTPSRACEQPARRFQGFGHLNYIGEAKLGRPHPRAGPVLLTDEIDKDDIE